MTTRKFSGGTTILDGRVLAPLGDSSILPLSISKIPAKGGLNASKIEDPSKNGRSAEGSHSAPPLNLLVKISKSLRVMSTDCRTPVPEAKSSATDFANTLIYRREGGGKRSTPLFLQTWSHYHLNARFRQNRPKAPQSNRCVRPRFSIWAWPTIPTGRSGRHLSRRGEKICFPKRQRCEGSLKWLLTPL